MKRIIYPLLLLILIFLIARLSQLIPIDLVPENRNSAPSLQHLFGTDWIGRDMLLRTLSGLQLSMVIGFITAIGASLIGLIFAVIASTHPIMDRIVTWCIDFTLSIPHILTLLFVSFLLGGGEKGILIGLILTHWPVITRVIRSEIKQLSKMPFIHLSSKLGRSSNWIVRHHYIPHLMPQIMVSFMIVFPHSIMHEAAVSFLGFGLSTDRDAIGVILAESMQYLTSGYWWLAFFPGLTLLGVILLFHYFTHQLRAYIERDRSYE
ncbi:peptide/nickel transport system permease protein [Gracilibacillus halotolerans]|uniref:Peptide/nickel transport system permease protein n=1 Tax=Gracilibacillus halotolerans TaxID=74386 RepID=A0A841RL18_9BACI|nr:ABC transporter permease [Gracilibacillus halotolerans]MBB6512156.1 peptide/nickel transport system permease protein [Gracilibacillus halotolerans]